MIQMLIHDKICENKNKVEAWFKNKRAQVELPFYSSVDIRDSGFKVASVDANIYPAGFNNICPTDKEESPEIVKKYLSHVYGDIQRVAILAEENSRNPYYWDNVHWIQTMIQQAGYDVRVCLPLSLKENMIMESASGHKITVSAFDVQNGVYKTQDGFTPQVIISNNDFSNAYEEWAKAIQIPVNPPRELGWHIRKKSEHFELYNQLAKEFSELIDVDPWLLSVETKVFENFNVNDLDSREDLALKVEEFLREIEDKYKAHNIQAKPTVFVKNNSGTYGLGVMSVQSGDDIRKMNSKARGKMNAAKGGKEVTEVILQEGIPTSLIEGTEVAEPVVYIIGCELAGGFLRTHTQKTPEDSLNSPGAVFKKMCVSDLKLDRNGCPLENVYGWVAKLASLAIGFEAQKKNIKIGSSCSN